MQDIDRPRIDLLKKRLQKEGKFIEKPCKIDYDNKAAISLSQLDVNSEKGKNFDHFKRKHVIKNIVDFEYTCPGFYKNHNLHICTPN